ncbi:MAG TPA: PfkB family carbohydrate kinase, partial [Flavisolibacter sp.]|nr:PfkB family carbohydrate kinase [Flavisolibacter sp.]
RIGGAGNVALNIQSLGAKAYVLAVTGDDEEAYKLKELFSANSINTDYSILSRSRITTNKTRIISRNQHMLRLDAEVTRDLNSTDEQSMVELIHLFIKKEQPDIIILEDYNKGTLTPGLIRIVIETCKEAGIMVAVDPKRKNFFEYKGVDLFKPNLKEVKDALNYIFKDVDHFILKEIHSKLFNELNHKVSLITLSENGIFYHEEKGSAIIPSHFRNIADVSGAGDTVIAVAALVYAVTKNVSLMSEIANIAGGLVCEEVGTAVINKEKLLHECVLLLS